jgi:hypothetical protein
MVKFDVEELLGWSDPQHARTRASYLKIARGVRSLARRPLAFFFQTAITTHFALTFRLAGWEFGSEAHDAARLDATWNAKPPNHYRIPAGSSLRPGAGRLGRERRGIARKAERGRRWRISPARCGEPHGQLGRVGVHIAVLVQLPPRGEHARAVQVRIPAPQPLATLRNLHPRPRQQAPRSSRGAKPHLDLHHALSQSSQDGEEAGHPGLSHHPDARRRHGMQPEVLPAPSPRASATPRCQRRLSGTLLSALRAGTRSRGRYSRMMRRAWTSTGTTLRLTTAGTKSPSRTLSAFSLVPPPPPPPLPLPYCPPASAAASPRPPKDCSFP